LPGVSSVHVSARRNTNKVGETLLLFQLTTAGLRMRDIKEG
jgi:hypothetical protein